ncbi:hypothetical protein KEU06_09745 [Pseudaminobacter sp. 19-2017]|uniref:Uncharacterized protein n=1 Tax=Pseudaminobacter soli (ex Zhang et al. 2022) TaxID=2831468 RepID=A0A942I2U0_9HYPH|nr:hypothetical protein [Pseudaminobacter soli]MBS3648889.1 hypothetical protein [Pseudaminobacter soli]
MNKNEEECIVAAAVRLERDNCTYSLLPPARHGEVIRLVNSLYQKGNPEFVILPEEQGFVTSHGRFVGRREARAIASLAGQTSSRDYNMTDLFSEDLW